MRGVHERLWARFRIRAGSPLSNSCKAKANTGTSMCVYEYVHVVCVCAYIYIHMYIHIHRERERERRKERGRDAPARMYILKGPYTAHGRTLVPNNIPTLVLQMAQSRTYLHTLRPKLGIICILGAMGQVSLDRRYMDQLGIEVYGAVRCQEA